MSLHRPQRGVALLEALIAWVILTIGLLGTCLATLQATRAAAEASLRTQAVVAADSLADRMRANPVATMAGGYRLALAAPPAAAAIDCVSSDCSSAELAQADLQDWYGRARLALPGFQSSVACDPDPACTSGAVRVITMSWEESGVDVGVVAQCGAAMPAGRACYQLRFVP